MPFSCGNGVFLAQHADDLFAKRLNKSPEYPFTTNTPGEDSNFRPKDEKAAKESTCVGWSLEVSWPKEPDSDWCSEVFAEPWHGAVCHSPLQVDLVFAA